MITAIRGYYENGKVILFEKPPVKTRTEVVVTFLTDENKPPLNSIKRMPGGLKGKVTLPEDFDEPLDDLKEYI